MARILIMLMMAIFASAAADSLVFRSPYLASPYTAYAAPYGAPYGAPYTSAALVAPAGTVVAPSGPILAPSGPVVASTGPVVGPAAVPLSSVSAYSYGSSYSIQDYAPLVNTAAPLYSSAYSLPYNYADWFYRR